MTYPSEATRPQLYSVCAFGGVISSDEGYQAAITMMLPTGEHVTMTRTKIFETAEEAARDYARDGHMIFEAQLRVLHMLADLHPAKIVGGSIPMCPLIDTAVFSTQA